VQSHIITNAGTAGELVTRIILLRCFDILAESGMVSYTEIPVLKFLARLANLNEDALQKLEEDEKRNKKQKQENIPQIPHKHNTTNDQKRFFLPSPLFIFCSEFVIPAFFVETN
jgi:hypothetical protein